MLGHVLSRSAGEPQTLRFHGNGTCLACRPKGTTSSMKSDVIPIAADGQPWGSLELGNPMGFRAYTDENFVWYVALEDTAHSVLQRSLQEIQVDLNRCRQIPSEDELSSLVGKESLRKQQCDTSHNERVPLMSEATLKT